MQGFEDHYGDMDFKIAGTRSGITAAQLDVKLPGVPVQWLCDALAPARAARLKILDALDKAAAVRHVLADTPQYGAVQINKELLGQLVSK